MVYEIGFRIRTYKPIIHLKVKGEKLPFDINTIRTYDYDLTDLDNVEEVKKRLEQTIDSFNFDGDNVNGLFGNDESNTENNIPIMPVLYQVLDGIIEIQKELKNNNVSTIGAVIEAMQGRQPQVSPEVALQTHLANIFTQNPEKLIQLSEIADKLSQKEK